MPTLDEIKKSLAIKIVAWKRQASALEAQLSQSKENAIENLEVQKKQLSEALNKFRTRVEETKAIADEKRSKIQGQIEHLQVQLALGKAETRDALESQKKKIREGISSFETTVDEGIGSLGEVFDELKYVVVDKVHSLEAELDALGVRFDMEKAKKKEQYEEKKKDIAAKIQEFNNTLEEKKHAAQDKAADLESEVKEGFERIRNAFKKMFS